MKTMMLTAALLAAPALAQAQECRPDGLRIEAGFLPPRPSVRTETVLVGYRDVWVERPVTVYETRTVHRKVCVGRDRHGRPVYACRPVCEPVPVTRMERVCEKRPIYETREVRCEPPSWRWGVSFGFGR